MKFIGFAPFEFLRGERLEVRGLKIKSYNRASQSLSQEVKMFGNFRNLALWKSSMNLTTEIYKLTKSFPDHERYGLASQMQRAAVSVPSNIAEGFGRESTRDLLRFLYTSRGSLMELSTQLEISINLGYISSDTIKPIIEITNEVNKLLNGLIYSMKSQLRKASKS